MLLWVKLLTPFAVFLANTDNPCQTLHAGNPAKTTGKKIILRSNRILSF